jgi:hypothetical protein
MPNKSVLLTLFWFTCSVFSSPVGIGILVDPCDGKHDDDPCVLPNIPVDGKCKTVAVSKDLA